MIWKSKAGKTLPMAVAKELIAHGPDGAAGDRLQGPLRHSRSARASRSKQTEEGKWRVEFDEPWAREGAKPPEGEDAGAANGDGDGGDAVDGGGGRGR